MASCSMIKKWAINISLVSFAFGSNYKDLYLAKKKKKKLQRLIPSPGRIYLLILSFLLSINLS